MRRTASLLLLVGLVPCARPASAAAPIPWNLQLEKGKRAPTTVTATNRCKATHTFEVSTGPGLTWMTFPAARSVEVAPGAAGTVPVTANASGLDVGEVENDVTVRCLDCKADLLCAQDVDTFHVRLKVLWPEEELKRLDPKEFVPEQVLLTFDDDARGKTAPPRYPAALPNVIAVSAIDANDKLYDNANRGPHVKVVAPGVAVFTTLPDGRYGPSTGTSIATAHVSGVVALLLAAHPGLSPKEVEDVLTSTTRDLGPPGRDDLFGWGAVDACLAVAKAANGQASCD